MTGALRIEVDREACRGSASCVRRAPQSFSLDAERKSVPASPPRDPDPVIRAAAAACPFFAIRVHHAAP